MERATETFSVQDQLADVFRRLDETRSGSFDEELLLLYKARARLRELAAVRLEPLINAELRGSTELTATEKRALAERLNDLLQSVGLAIADEGSDREMLLYVDTGRDREHGQFQLRRIGNTAFERRRFARGLPWLRLVPVKAERPPKMSACARVHISQRGMTRG